MIAQSNEAVRSPRTSPVPDLSDMVWRALMAVQVVMPDGQRQHSATRKVRAREMNAAGVLETNLSDLHTAGATHEQGRSVGLAILRWIDLKWGAIGTARDLRAALITETRAQASVDVIQIQAADVSRATDADLETLIPRLAFQLEATQAAILAAECELHERAEQRAASRRQLAPRVPLTGRAA